MKLLIENGKIYIEGIETKDPTLIGFYILDFAEKHDLELNTNG